MTTAPDMLKQFGGVPVASNEFAGWWGNDIWFVDFDNGIRADGQGRNNIKDPQKDLYQAITDAGAGDTIYMRPRTAIGSQWHTSSYITPASTEAVNWTVPMAKSYLSIIGTIKSPPQGGQIHRPLLKAYTSQATPVITVLAPYFVMENIGIGSTKDEQVDALIKVTHYDAGTTQKGYSAVINNCAFRNVEVLTGAVSFETGVFNTVCNSTFWKCVVGVRLGSGGRVNEGNAVINNDFYGIHSEIACDVLMGDVRNVLIDSNRFHHGQPSYALLVISYYVDAITSGTGILSNNYFGTTNTTIGTACIMRDIQGVGNMCENSTVWMTTT